MVKKKLDSIDDKRHEQQKLQEKILLYQILQNHIEQLKQQAVLLEREFIEIDGSIHAVEAVSSGKTGHEVLVPIGSGCFCSGEIINNKKFLLNVGTGIVVNKKYNEAKEFLEDKKKEREKLLNKLKEELENTLEKLRDLAGEIQEMQKG